MEAILYLLAYFCFVLLVMAKLSLGVLFGDIGLLYFFLYFKHFV